MSKEKRCCCDKQHTKENHEGLRGIVYGLVPHAGCIAFIAFTVLGVTAGTAMLTPLLANAYMFYGLIALSFVLATISAVLYLRKCNCLSKSGIRSKWKYTSTLYGTTIAVNLLLFLVIFPMLANVNSSVAYADSETSLDNVTIAVEIPCQGHAPLITDAIKKVDGVRGVHFDLPNEFTISYDSAKTSSEEILSLKIFEEFKANVVR
jgi:copper chaperone CopZ